MLYFYIQMLSIIKNAVRMRIAGPYPVIYNVQQLSCEESAGLEQVIDVVES